MPRRRPSKYPYEDAKQLYVEGIVNDEGERRYPTYADVAELLQIPQNRLRERGAKYNWTDARAAWQAQLERARMAKKAQDVAKERDGVDEHALKVSKLGANMVMARLGEMAQELQRRNRAKKAYDELIEAAKAEDRMADAMELADTGFDPWAPHPVDVRELQALAATMTAWHSLQLKALGQPDVATVRHEVSGPDGGPIQQQTVSEVLVRDDRSRLVSLLVAVQRAELAPQVVAGAGVSPQDPAVLALRAGRRAGELNGQAREGGGDAGGGASGS